MEEVIDIEYVTFAEHWLQRQQEILCQQRYRQQCELSINKKETPMEETKRLYNFKLVIEPTDTYGDVQIYSADDILATGQEEAIRIGIAQLASTGITPKDIERGKKFILAYHNG